MTTMADQFVELITTQRRSFGDDDALKLAKAMFAAGGAAMRNICGARKMAELHDQLAHDYTAEVLGQPPRSGSKAP